MDPHEDKIFYDKYGMKMFEKRYAAVNDILNENEVKSVNISIYI